MSDDGRRAPEPEPAGFRRRLGIGRFQIQHSAPHQDIMRATLFSACFQAMFAVASTMASAAEPAVSDETAGGWTESPGRDSLSENAPPCVPRQIM
jgi:hypothetical protein